jgi:2-polyprenyl-6-methoxyphenol hydroxylase-like FAD-dependent oxidoreductase
MQDVDVLIVGAGPTGLMLALELAMQNVSFRITDAETARSTKSRALVLHPRSLELLNRHGIANDLMKLGRVNMAIRIFINKTLIVGANMQNIGYGDSAFPSPLFISQQETESFLDKALERYGKVAELGVRATKVEQDETGVTVTLTDKERTEEQLRCKYVIGCDGSHSIVRTAAGLAFKGDIYPQDFVLADVRISAPTPIEDSLSLFVGASVLIIFPLSDGVYRLVASRPEFLSSDAEPSLADFQTIFDKLAPIKDAKIVDPVWIARFRLHHRGVEQYRAGRLIVAGDAAHIHSPAGGQGMNTGMQDAVNLGWKLAQVLRGEKDDSFLDSYNAERHKIGRYLLQGTDRLFQLGATTNPLFIFLRNNLMPWFLPWLFRDKQRLARRLRFISQLGIRYRDSPIVATAAGYKGPLRGGDRAPDGELQGLDAEGKETDTMLLALCTGPTHHLLLFKGLGHGVAAEEAVRSVEEGFANENWVKLHTIVTVKDEVGEGVVGAGLDKGGAVHHQYGFETQPGYVLVRPDGHITHIGPLSAIGELKEWLAK